MKSSAAIGIQRSSSIFNESCHGALRDYFSESFAFSWVLASGVYISTFTRTTLPTSPFAQPVVLVFTLPFKPPLEYPIGYSGTTVKRMWRSELTPDRVPAWQLRRRSTLHLATTPVCAFNCIPHYSFIFNNIHCIQPYSSIFNCQIFSSIHIFTHTHIFDYSPVSQINLFSIRLSWPAMRSGSTPCAVRTLCEDFGSQHSLRKEYTAVYGTGLRG